MECDIIENVLYICISNIFRIIYKKCNKIKKKMFINKIKMNKELYKPFKYTGKGVFKMSVYVKNEKTGKPKLIHFGHKDFEDFTQHKDKERRKNYLTRTKGIKNKKGELTYKDKNSKNYWARKVLWDA